MSKTVARYRPSYREVYIRQPAWSWLFIGVVLGFLLGLIYAGKSSAPPAPPAPPAMENPPAPAVPETPTPAPDNSAAAPRFEFYNVLPGKQAENTADNPAQASGQTEAAQLDTGAALPPDSLMLQVASFQNVQDALGLKTQLQGLGFPALVLQATINGSDWFRVRLGPFTDAQQATDARARLQQNGFQAIVVNR